MEAVLGALNELRSDLETQTWPPGEYERVLANTMRTEGGASPRRYGTGCVRPARCGRGMCRRAGTPSQVVSTTCCGTHPPALAPCTVSAAP